VSRIRRFLASRKRRWALGALVLGALWAVQHRRNQWPEVQTSSARRGALTLTIAASGRVDGSASDLGFGDSGTLDSLYVSEGEKVRERQLLARMRRSVNFGLTVEGADVVEAPYAGTVVQIYRREGSAIQPGVPVLRLVRSGGAWVTAFLDSEDAGWLRLGHRLLVRAGGFLARPFDAVVESIGQEAVQREDMPGSARQVRVRLRLAADGFNLPVGTSVDVDGDVPMVKEALLVPVAAVVRQRGHTYVWTVTEQHVRRVEVRTGPNNLRQIVIAEGLTAGETVVVEGKTDLKDGQRVRTKPWPGEDLT